MKETQEEQGTRYTKEMGLYMVHIVVLIILVLRSGLLKAPLLVFVGVPILVGSVVILINGSSRKDKEA